MVFQIDFDVASGVFTVDWFPSELAADNNNTLKAPGYAVFDLYSEYKVTESFTLYGGIDNVLDKDYAATVLVNPSGANPAYIHPGNGRTAYIGAKFTF